MNFNYKCVDSYFFQELQQETSTQDQCECVMHTTNFYLCHGGYVAVMLLLAEIS